MKRTMVNDIAQLAQCSPDFVRKAADKGLIKARRDCNGWRVFPNPQQAAEMIQRLLLGETTEPEHKNAPVTAV